MNSSVIFLIFFLIFFLTCNPENNIFKVDKIPSVIYQEPLPPFPKEMKKQVNKLDTRLLISEEGKVLEAQIISSSSNKEWDSLAIEKIKKWIFTPAILNNKPIKIWITQPIRISIKEPLFLPLFEIVFDNATIAFQIYDSLINGADFDVFVNKYSVSESKKDNGYIGLINIRNLDPEIQKYLEKLEENEFTKPIIYKGKYTIFKRSKLM